MRAVLRKLEQKRHWDSQSWLSQGDVQADVAKCLSTDGNTLSVYVLDKPKEQLDRVVAALAAGRDYLVRFDLAIAPENILDKCGIVRASSSGDTLDRQVNEWHQRSDRVEHRDNRTVSDGN